MRLIWPILKESGIYFWEEFFYLILFNLITIVTVFPGLTIIFSAQQEEISPIVYLPLAILLSSLFPYALFGLFWTVSDIAQGKAIKFTTFFSGGRQMLKHAYVWWFINVVVLLVLVANIVFYNNQATVLATYAAFFFVGLLITWLIIQLFALSFYAKLVNPGFKVATRNAMALLAMKPIPLLFVAILTAVIIGAGIIIRLVGLLVAFSLVATLVNMTNHLILKETYEAQEEN